MLTRVIRVLVAFVVALGLAVPAGVRAMPMPAAVTGMAKTVDLPCQHCPQPNQTGNTTPDKMAGCQAFACVSAPAVLPSPVLVPARAFLGAAYLSPVPAPLAGASPAPDPFPPRSIALV